MRILIACEFSGVVRDAFIRKGHYAISCDLLPSDSDLGSHYQGDVFDIINDGFDMMIAHPPCTYLSIAGASALFRGNKLNLDRHAKGLDAAIFFNKLINANIPKICIENPTQLRIYNIEKCTQVIQPYMFGHPFSKRTCLWLKDLPNLLPTNILTEYDSTKTPGNWYNKGGKDRQKNRAKTFQGIADAMAKQWG